jgi:hypothetical protein
VGGLIVNGWLTLVATLQKTPKTQYVYGCFLCLFLLMMFYLG